MDYSLLIHFVLLLILTLSSQYSGSLGDTRDIRTVNECLYTRYGTAYIGNVSTTRSGHTCQQWDSQAPHAHPYTSGAEFPDDTVTSAVNYCRNPRRLRDGGVWCFTTDPNQPWEYCDVPYCECKIHRTGHGYLGTHSFTYSGLKCQRWDSQSPHTHSYTNPATFPDPSIADANNYCRNPSPTWTWGTFCLTEKENTRTQHCSIPFCECKTTESGNKYEAYQNSTVNGRICQSWLVQTPHEHTYTDISMYPDTRFGLVANHCRNPDNSAPGGPWCYTTDPDVRWEYCAIPSCEYYVPQLTTTTTLTSAGPLTSTTPFIAVTPTVKVIEENSGSVIQECKFTRIGSTYRGQVAVTTSGKTCQSWTSQSPHKHPDVPVQRLPDASVDAAGNACRNPNMAPGGPWCYTSVDTTRYEYCPVPLCDCKISRSGVSYVGNQRVTNTGKPCQRWDSQTPHRHDYGDESFPEDGGAGGAADFCRNPDNENPDGPWCFTTSPNKRWEYCRVPFCECRQDKAGLEYAGQIAVTRSGRTCQRWDAQTPHSHGYVIDEMFPEGSATNAANYCRNPDDQEGGGPWCYTVESSVRWEYCDVPLCELQPPFIDFTHDMYGTKLKSRSETAPGAIDCKLSTGGKEYQGSISHTMSYLACQRWDAQTPHKHPFTDARLLPDTSVTAAGDRCRNPGGERADGPWCYTLDPHTEWQYCPVPSCGCKKNKAGWSYNGTLSNTVSGKTCQRWDSQTPHNHSFKASSFPDPSIEGASNFCRNPGRWQPGGPWCFTTDPAVRWQYCAVPFCECRDTITGQEYGGKIARTKSGTLCQRWDAQTPHAHRNYDDRKFPDGSTSSASNFCRNPTPNEMVGPWCYTQDVNKTWELCDVPMCESDGDEPLLSGPGGPVVYGKTSALLSKASGGRRLGGEIVATVSVLTILVVLLLGLLLAIAYRQRHYVRRFFVKAPGFTPEAFDNPVYGTALSVGACAVRREGDAAVDITRTSRVDEAPGQPAKNTAD